MPLQAGLAAAGRLNGAAIGTKALASATHTDSTTSFSGAMAGSLAEIWTSENALAVTRLTPPHSGPAVQRLVSTWRLIRGFNKNRASPSSSR